MVEFRRWLPDDGAIMGSGGTRPTLYSLQSNARPLRDYVPVFTVSQVAKYVKFTVDSDRVLGNLYVTGEVTNFSHASSGHCYFTLKDGDSQLRCVKFRDDPGEEHLANGAAVTTHGRMTFYPARGELQYYVDLVQPEGVGEIHMDFLRVKAKLKRKVSLTWDGSGGSPNSQPELASSHRWRGRSFTTSSRCFPVAIRWWSCY